MLRVVEAVAGWVGAVALFAMMALTFLDVIARYLFAAPIYGVVEMIQFLLALMVFVGIALVNARSDHIVVELFSASMARRWPRVFGAWVLVLSVVGMGLMVLGLWRATQHAASRGTASVVLQIPLVWVIGAMAALGAIGLVLLILSISRQARHHGEAP
jgi:TRAP-type transport system small permease protein